MNLNMDNKEKLHLPAIKTDQNKTNCKSFKIHRKAREIPFHIPHNKQVKKNEYTQSQIAEPLTGFTKAQEDRYKRERKPSKVILEPISKEEDVPFHKKLRMQVSQADSQVKVKQTVDPLKIKPQIPSQQEVIDYIREHPECGFLYMIYAVPKNNVYFTPYYLKVVPYAEIDKNNYLTISPCGVSHYTEDVTFLDLKSWEQEYKIFCCVNEIKFFKVFRYWKAFYVWRKTILFKKFTKSRNQLRKKLFALTPVLGRALLAVQSECCRLYNASFAELSEDMDIAFFYFHENQRRKLEFMSDQLSTYRSDVLNTIIYACHNALLLQGFTFDDRNFAPFQIVRGKPTGGMSYPEKANKRKYCEILARFIKLVDYMNNYMLYRVASLSNQEMAEMLRTHMSFAPTTKKLESGLVDEVMEDIPRNSTTCKWALFQVDAYITLDGQIVLSPSEKIIHSYIANLSKEWDQYIRNFQNFLNDPELQRIVQPTIMGKQVEWSAGKSPNLNFLLNQDKALLDNIAYIPDSITDAYAVVWTFVKILQPIIDTFNDGCQMVPAEMVKERDINIFRKWCDQFVKQLEEINEIVSFQPLGMIFLNLEPFQEIYRPVPRRLLDVVIGMTPDIGHEAILEILEGCTSTNEKLNAEPTTAEQLVEFSLMLDTVDATVAYLEERSEYVRELYDLMGEFNIAIPPDDMQEYLGLSIAIGGLRTNCDARLESRGEIASKFADRVGKDVMDLMTEIANIREEVVGPWLYDASSDPEMVHEKLSDLMDLLNSCVDREKQIREWQKMFKMPPLRLEQLEEVINDIKLRQLLWNSQREWNQYYKSWYEDDFMTLDLEEIQTITANYAKIMNQLDKGLPFNKIVPECKETIELIKLKLPVISYLRNPALKARHWVKIEEVLRTRFMPDDTITLTILEKLGIFEHSDDLMDVSGQASSEAGLELLLKKVEEMWTGLEFPVVTHRDARDAYILAGLEEIQATLDESQVHVATILSSRNCAPIKGRAEDWAVNLDLFSNTIDEWVKCQQTWIYLEAIFSAPDIQRQLPNETRLFTLVDKSWKGIMRNVVKVPLAMPAGTQPGLLEEFIKNNQMLDQIMKCLEAYLETKRVSFARFYFLSNDELLEILAQTRNPHSVQPHLRKCFDAIAKLEFGVKLPESEEMTQAERDALQAELAPTAAPEELTTDIVAMLSPQGERVTLGRGLKARGSVEDWLGKVEEAMFISVKNCMKFAIKDYYQKPRVEWVKSHANQIVLTVSQLTWAREIHEIFDSGSPAAVNTVFVDFEKKCITDLNDLAALTRQDLTPLFRKVLCALITVDVHARDTVDGLVRNRVHTPSDFEWLKMLRYYWEPEVDDCIARMSNGYIPYGHEYLGADGVLVITPLTDRCYLCLVGALQLDMGGAPAGPAGTGKTETTKDLAKSVAVQCIVFNCSEGLDYKMMGRFFSGLAQSGAWCCFDEFNRIDVEVLSVIAQQLITIRNAKVARVGRFMFEGREIKLQRSCAAFITMNPGYAGRTELPDNLKALFRPMSMMVPDYALIAEVILYSEGFEGARGLAKKMVLMYELCDEQLSKQDHYDFGMRAVKSVLVMAGALKRAQPDRAEQLTLLMALRDSNVPKFLAADAALFAGILNDLFPGVVLPETDYGAFTETIEEITIEHQLQVEACQVLKVIQLHETMKVRWGVMVVGPTGGGKTTTIDILGDTLSRLKEKEIIGDYYETVQKYIMNPKSLTIGELYGEVNLQTLEWHDGILPKSLRTAVQSEVKDNQWLICDGPVDAVWIENMNTVLDDNKMLCLSNSERIKLTPQVHMVFEVADLANASPATVSRCGMVYVDPADLGVLPYVRSWLIRTVRAGVVSEENSIFVYELFQLVDRGLNFVRTRLQEIQQVNISKISAMCCLLCSLLSEPGDRFTEKTAQKVYIAQCFAFCYLWSVGGNLAEQDRAGFEDVIKRQFESLDEEIVYIPTGINLWNMYMATKERNLENWNQIIPNFEYDPNLPFFETLVPTVDTVRYGYLIEKFLCADKPVFITGTTGVGKSVIASSVLNTLALQDTYVAITMNFSAQTSSSRTQEMIESRLEKRRKNTIGAPLGKKVIIFIDDVNMPKLDLYGSQPTIELLRQILEFGGMYERTQLQWQEIVDVSWAVACAPPGGGRHELTARFVRHFAMLNVAEPGRSALLTIFKSILEGHMEDFHPEVSSLADGIVNSAVDVYADVSAKLLPTPSKAHYLFNLRDLSKTMQGVLQADAAYMKTPDIMLRLFYHECLRVFHDRLINLEDRTLFYRLLKSICQKNFGNPVIELPDVGIIENAPMLMFGDFMNTSTEKENRVYKEITDMEKLIDILNEYLEDSSLGSAAGSSRIVLFAEAATRAVRAARILRAERGHAVLAGPAGCGRRTVAALAAAINLCGVLTMEITRNFGTKEFHDDLRKLYLKTGLAYEDTVFLLTDTQIVKEEFLEDINNVLNSGEVTNLFVAEDYEVVQSGMREVNKGEVDRDVLYSAFISRARSKMHLVLCMSPVGDTFRHRCRTFPSLVNCCTIDWYSNWPPEALLAVAEQSLKELNDKALIANISTMCVTMHQNVEVMSERLYEEMRRHFYTTPSSYLDLMKLFLKTLDRKRQEIIRARERISGGLKKLYETNAVVGSMEKQVAEMEPVLAAKATQVAALYANMRVEQAAADKVRTAVLEDEAKAKIKADETKVLSEDAARDLGMAMPAVEAARTALAALDKKDVQELKSLLKPPALVRFVMEPVCVLMSSKTDWDSAKKMMGDTNFIKSLQEYDKEHIPDATLKRIKTYINHKDFQPEIVVKVSKVCRSMVLWVRAIDMYAKVYKVVEPKIAAHKEAAAVLKSVMAVLKAKQRELQDVEEQLEKMKQDLKKVEEDCEQLKADCELAAARLSRAGKLTQALAGEQTRWALSVKSLTQLLRCTVGDVIISCGCIAYLGAFGASYRRELLVEWVKLCRKLQIPSSETFDLVTIMADAYTIGQWNSQGLPRDEMSTENAILVTKAGRWPLIIDPQEQANRWIKRMERDNELVVTKLTEATDLRKLEMCIRLGRPLLVEDVSEAIDPMLAPVLSQKLIFQAGRWLLRLGDSDIEYDDNFKLYLTSKLANPHYLPEACVQVTLVNFNVTLSGLEDQLLADVVRLERPDLELMRTELLDKINADQTQLKEIEDKILRMLYASTGNILDDEALIETLNESKETSEVIEARLEESKATELKMLVAREKYRGVTVRGAVLYFVVDSLAGIDPMYQFSLNYFAQIFNSVVETSEKNEDLEIRLQTLYREITLAIYSKVSRGLFEKHKLIYSFLLNVAILKHDHLIEEDDWSFLLRGPAGTKVVPPKKPEIGTLSDFTWLASHHLDETNKTFKGLAEDCLRNISITLGSFILTSHYDKSDSKSASVDWESRLDDFYKLMLVKALQQDRLVFAVAHFVSRSLGTVFIESPTVTLNTLFQDTSNTIPLVFVLSTGSDPFATLERFATERGVRSRLHSVSLGQGQGPVAEKMINQARNKGDWVFLQNCHLATSWMPSLALIVARLAEDEAFLPHTDFRLFLSSMPTAAFPRSVLQNSLKVTNEPPKGLKANVRRALMEIDQDQFESNVLEQVWRKMVFGICLFHAVIQERKKFGALGWNVTYEFNDTDRECALLNLQMFCADGEIPWKALFYITSQITYGGRVTDAWDQRCLAVILKQFFSPPVIEEEYTYSESGIYYCPTAEDISEYRSYVDSWPIVEQPEIFGMHDNANIAFQNKETTNLTQTIINVQPRRTTAASGESPDEICLRLCEDIKSSLVHKINMDQIEPSIMQLESGGLLPPLTTVLLHEAERYDKLLQLLHTTLVELQKAIKGVVVMSEDLEAVFRSFLNNLVPGAWSRRAYKSVKPLGSWVRDLVLRTHFIQDWLDRGGGPSVWISGLFQPRELSASVLQSHARAHALPLTELYADCIPSTPALYLLQEELHTKKGTMYGKLTKPASGINVHGLFIEAGRWDPKENLLVDSLPGESLAPMPVLNIVPTTSPPSPEGRYRAPTYRTPARDNFLVQLYLPTRRSDDYWVLRGCALLTQTPQ